MLLKQIAIKFIKNLLIGYFIKTSKVIIINSYHGIYWATLMRIKVLTMVYLHSNKFNYFKYPPKEYTGDLILIINQYLKYHQAYKLYKPHTRSL